MKANRSIHMNQRQERRESARLRQSDGKNKQAIGVEDQSLCRDWMSAVRANTAEGTAKHQHAAPDIRLQGDLVKPAYMVAYTIFLTWIFNRVL